MYSLTGSIVVRRTTLRREKRLPLRGEVVVEVGCQVRPGDILARAKRYAAMRLLNVAQALGIPPSEADRHVVKGPGEAVRAGEVVAERKGGLRQAICRAPFAGVIVAVHRGWVLLCGKPSEVVLRACYPGWITRVIPSCGVELETEAGWIQGAGWCGGEAAGVLRVLVGAPEEPLTAAAIPVGRQDGHILVGGATADREALLKAAKVRARGVIVGGLPAAVAEMARTLPFPVMVTEGFGRLPMAAPVFEWLQSSDGQAVCLNGGRAPGMEPTRPEVLLLGAVGTDSASDPAPVPIEPGAVVRLVRAPYWGQVGTVRALSSNPQTFESGVLALAAAVELRSGATVFVPLFNLERIA